MIARKCVMVTAIGKNEWITSAIQYAWPIIKEYFEGNGHNVQLIRSSPFDNEVQHPSWLWLKCHEILPTYEYILTWNLDILPVVFKDDIFKILDMNLLGAVVEDSSIHYTFPHFKYNCGLVGVPNNYKDFCAEVYAKWIRNPNSWPSYEQYYVNMEIGERKINVFEIPKKYAWYYNSPNYETASCWHYTNTISKNKVTNLFKKHYERIFNVLL
jgi:hypothetical protein